MVITVSSIKGGVGKSSVVLLLANNLASRGRKVLVIDTDLNNTVTVYYTMGIGRIGEICERQNVSLAFAQGELDGKNIIQSRKENIFIVPSSLRLLDQRSMESVEIKRVLRSPKGFDESQPVHIWLTEDGHKYLIDGDELLRNVAILSKCNFVKNSSGYKAERTRIRLSNAVSKIAWYVMAEMSDGFTAEMLLQDEDFKDAIENPEVFEILENDIQYLMGLGVPEEQLRKKNKMGGNKNDSKE